MPTVTITITDEIVQFVVDSIMSNFPEASHGCALRCTDWHYDQFRFTFEDGESGKTYKLNRDQINAAFPLMFTDKWPKGCTQPPGSNSKEVWDDWLCQADAQDFDAFAQLACLGEVIYG